MDFTLNEELTAVRELAGEIFAGHTAADRIRAVEQSASRVDGALWADLGKAGLLGIALPEEDGGAGLGPAALCVLLEEQGRRVAPVPLWPSAVAALAVAAHGTAEQRRAILPGAADGSARLTVALEEFGPGDPAAPECAAERAGGGWRLTGTKAVVPSPSGAGHVLVAAATADGPGLFLVAAGAAGTAWEDAETTSHDMSGTLTLSGAAGEPVGAPGSGALGRTLDLARVALAAVQLGVAQGALRLAADYLSEREQFGRPLATFQAVQHQLADCYIEAEAMGVCLWQAVTLLEDTAVDGTAPGDAAATASAALVAKWWADEAGLNVVHRVQHVHGGIGVDTEYPVHRFFLWGKQIAGTLGGASADLDRLGTLLSARAAS